MCLHVDTRVGEDYSSVASNVWGVLRRQMSPLLSCCGVVRLRGDYVDIVPDKSERDISLSNESVNRGKHGCDGRRRLPHGTAPWLCAWDPVSCKTVSHRHTDHLQTGI